MSEPLKGQRAIFPPGKQREFIEVIEKAFSIQDMSRLCTCSTRTIRDWRREKFAMQLACLHTLCKHARTAVPKEITLRDRYSHVRLAGTKGARAVIKKYGRIPVDETYRKQQWRNWWKTRGKFADNPLFRRKSIYKPGRSVSFAEYIGIIMGDGGITNRQVTITLHHKDDLAYSKFVIELIQRLFHVRPSVYHAPKDSINDIVVSSTSLVDFLHGAGLPIGNKVKQQFDIPQWIKNRKAFAVACVRGLVDTDGSVFTHKYLSGRKQYRYKKLSFCSHSVPLQLSVAKILADLGMSPRLTKFEVRLESIADMRKYFAIVGSHNPKHLERYRA